MNSFLVKTTKTEDVIKAGLCLEGISYAEVAKAAGQMVPTARPQNAMMPLHNVMNNGDGKLVAGGDIGELWKVESNA